MGIIKDIGDVAIKGIELIIKEVKEAKKRKAKIQKMKMEIDKTLIQLKNEIYTNREIISRLHRKGGLSVIKPNDKAFASVISGLKISAMEEVKNYPKKYIKKPPKKVAVFLDLLSLTLNKIDRLKTITTTPTRELALSQPVRLGARIMYLNRCFDKLIKDL